MENALADLFSIDDLVDFSVNGKLTSVMLLTTRRRIERRLIDDNDVSVRGVLEISENFKNLCIELIRLVVIVVQVNSFLDVSSLVENLLGRLGELLLLQVHLIVQVIRLRDTSDFRNGIG